MSSGYVNRFGRRGGRGFRPWLLLPKVIAVAIYLGGLSAVLLILATSRLGQLDPTDPRHGAAIQQISLLFRRLIIPSMVAAIVLGVGLLLQHPRVFLQMRWVQIKLLSLAILLPCGHFYCRSYMKLMRQAVDQQTAVSAARHLTVGVAAVLIGSAWVIVVGRLKPRFGQKIRTERRDPSSSMSI